MFGINQFWSRAVHHYCYICPTARLEIHHKHKIHKREATGESVTPYMGCVEVNLKILEIGAFNEDVLMLVI